MKNKLFEYINDRYDNDGVIPSLDEIYLKFQLQFDNGWPIESIDEIRTSFMAVHDLSGVIIQGGY